MDTIQTLLLSDNAWMLVIAIIIIAVIVGFLSKAGIISITTKNLTVGASNKEREIIRQQVEYINLHINSLENNMTKPDGYNKWRGKYVASRVINEYIDWITFNHLKDTPEYISIKQDKLISMLIMLTEKPYFHDDEFINMIKEDTEHSIKRLVEIREMYNKFD